MLVSINAVKATIASSLCQAGVSVSTLERCFDAIDAIPPAFRLQHVDHSLFSTCDESGHHEEISQCNAGKAESRSADIAPAMVSSKPCRRLARRGDCKFGNNCYFSHALGKFYECSGSDEFHPECMHCAAEEVRVQTIADADCQSGSTRGSASSLEQHFSGAEVEKLFSQCAEKTAEHTAEKTAEHTAQKCARKFENALDIAHSTHSKKPCSPQIELEQKVSEIERIEGDMK